MDIYSLISSFISLFFLPLWETARYRLEYCLKGPLNPNQPTNQYEKRYDFDFDIVNFPFPDDDVPLSTSYGVYISPLIRFARVSSHDDFHTRNNVLTAKLLKQGYRYHKLGKACSKFYRRHFDLVFNYNVGLKTFLLHGLSEPELYGDLVYEFRK